MSVTKNYKRFSKFHSFAEILAPKRNWKLYMMVLSKTFHYIYQVSKNFIKY